MKFSEFTKITDHAVVLSPNGLCVAYANQFRLIIQDIRTLAVVNVCRCADTISDIHWSPDSSLVLCIMRKRNSIQVWSASPSNWSCKIDEGSTGLIDACWAMDSRHILTTCDYFLRITVWSLSNTSVSYMKYPKACPKNLAFSPGGRYLCLLERRDLQDCMSIFDCQLEWRLVVNVQLPTKDSCGLEWSPDGRYIAVYDSCLYDTVAIFTADGRHLHTFSMSKGENYHLGVKSIAWSPSGQLLAIGGFDQKCRILNHANWSCLVVLQHPLSKPIAPQLGLSPTGEVLESTLNSDSNRSYRVAIYQEEASEQLAGNPPSATPAGAVGRNYSIVSKPIQIPCLKPDPKKPNPKIGVGLCLFSPTGRYLVTRVDNAPGTLWVWRAGLRFSLISILTHTSGPVLSAAWDPQSTARLALCIGTDVVFMWTPQGCVAVEVGAHFSVRSLSWNFSGDALLLKSSDEFCLCYLDHESTAGNEPSALDEFWIAPTSRVMRRLGESDDVGLTDKTTDEAFLQNAMIEEDTDTSDMPRWARNCEVDKQREKENHPTRSASSQFSKSPPTSLRSGWKYPVTTPAFHRGAKTLAAKK
uniref:WD repeat-containing protein WRAP73 n=3 Tax=Schistocephalus solidus TaxID=70667 RepID=A0A0X3NRC1_SCHSO